jgi:hypothetical protein
MPIALAPCRSSIGSLDGSHLILDTASKQYRLDRLPLPAIAMISATCTSPILWPPEFQPFSTWLCTELLSKAYPTASQVAYPVCRARSRTTGDRQIWDQFVAKWIPSLRELKLLAVYETLASLHLRAYLEGLHVRDRVLWEPYALPPLPAGFLDEYGQHKAARAATRQRRREQSAVLVPLFPYLLNLRSCASWNPIR